MWDKFEARIVIDLSGRSKDELLEEHCRWLEAMLAEPLNDFYGSEAVDLVFVVHAGKMQDGDPPEMHEGWGLSDEDIWGRIPGETMDEKRKYILRAMEDEDPDDL